MRSRTAKGLCVRGKPAAAPAAPLQQPPSVLPRPLLPQELQRGAPYRVLGAGLPWPRPRRRRSASRPAPPRVTSAPPPRAPAPSPPPLPVPLSLPESRFLLPRGRDPEPPEAGAAAPGYPGAPGKSGRAGTGGAGAGWAGLRGLSGDRGSQEPFPSLAPTLSPTPLGRPSSPLLGGGPWKLGSWFTLDPAPRPLWVASRPAAASRPPSLPGGHAGAPWTFPGTQKWGLTRPHGRETFPASSLLPPYCPASKSLSRKEAAPDWLGPTAELRALQLRHLPPPAPHTHQSQGGALRPAKPLSTQR